MPVEFLTHDERYARTGEYMAIVKQAWTSREPFDHAGAHYTFADFVSDVFPVQEPRPRLSFGGSSPAAYRTGGAEAGIYCLRGEPLASTSEQIESVKAAAVTGGGGNSNALAGTPDTVAQAICDYVDLGVDIISMPGYDLLTDAVDVGREVIPIVRDEVAKRDRAVA